MAEKVDPDDLKAAMDLQAVLSLSRLSSVKTVRKRYADYPRPPFGLSGGKVRWWRRQDIVQCRVEREAMS